MIPPSSRQFTGSEHWYRHGLVRDILFTDGAKYVADQGGAYWLLDEIAIAQRFEKAVSGRGIPGLEADGQSRPQRASRLRGRQRPHRLQKAIPYTDFPAEGIELWFENSTIYLPSEH